MVQMRTVKQGCLTFFDLNDGTGKRALFCVETMDRTGGMAHPGNFWNS
jgi:hypothetical protein